MGWGQWKYANDGLSEAKDLRSILKRKRQSQHLNRLERLAGQKRYTKKAENEIFDAGQITITYSYNPLVTVSLGKMYSQKDMDEAEEKLKEVQLVLAASVDEIAGLRKRVEEAEKRATFAEAELEEFKTVAAFFLGDFVTDVDNIMPDDLEYGLAQFEKQIEETASVYDNLPLVDTNKGWVTILQLCKDLGMTSIDGLTETQSIKIFIKEFVRHNYLLRNNNNQLRETIAAKEAAIQKVIDTL